MRRLALAVQLALWLALCPVIAQTTAQAGFDTSGVVVLGGTDTIPQGLAVQKDGHLLVLIAEQEGQRARLTLLQLTKDGRPVASFAGTGRWASDWQTKQSLDGGLLVQAADGTLVVVAEGDNSSTIFRLDAQGQPLRGFGTTGQVSLGFNVWSLAFLPDGHLLLAGGQPNFTGASEGRPAWSVARLDAQGHKDKSFQGGFVLPFGHAQGNASALWPLPDGGFLAAGWTRPDENVPAIPTLARFLADGRPDPAFGSGGRATLPQNIPFTFCTFYDLNVDAQQRITVGGGCDSFANGLPIIARARPDGSWDITPKQPDDLQNAGYVEYLVSTSSGLLATTQTRHHEGSGNASLLRVAPDGQLSVYALPKVNPANPNTSLWRIAGVGRDAQGNLLLLEQTETDGPDGLQTFQTQLRRLGP